MANPLYDRLVILSRPGPTPSGYSAAEKNSEFVLVQTWQGVQQPAQIVPGGTWQFKAPGTQGTRIPASVQMKPRSRGNNPVDLADSTPKVYFDVFIDGFDFLLDARGNDTELREGDRLTDVTMKFQRRFVLMGVYPTGFGYQLMVEQSKP